LNKSKSFGSTEVLEMLGFSEYFEPLLSIQRLPDDGHPLDILPENERM
jgi:hypothetical protein